MEQNRGAVLQTVQSAEDETWGSFLTQKLALFFEREKFCDLDLVFQGEQMIRAHSVVAQAFTDFFVSEATAASRSVTSMTMPACLTKAAVEPLVQFMYTGKLVFDKPLLQSVYEASRYLRVEKISKLMEDKFHANLLNSRGEQTKCKDGMSDQFPLCLTDDQDSLLAEESQDHFGKANFQGRQCMKRKVVRAHSLHASIPPSKQAKGAENCEKKAVKNFTGEDTGGPTTKKQQTLDDNVCGTEVTRLTTKDVYLKYMSLDGQCATEKRAHCTQLIISAIKKNPNLIKESKPVKLKLLEKSPLGCNKIVNATVKAQLDVGGKRRFQIVFDPDLEVRRDSLASRGLPRVPPWRCEVCCVDFRTYYDCRKHHSKVHGQKFDSRSCEHCGFMSSTRMVLAHHLFSKHGVDVAEKSQSVTWNQRQPTCMSPEVLSKHRGLRHHRGGDTSFRDKEWTGTGHKSTGVTLKVGNAENSCAEISSETSESLPETNRETLTYRKRDTGDLNVDKQNSSSPTNASASVSTSQGTGVCSQGGSKSTYDPLSQQLVLPSFSDMTSSICAGEPMQILNLAVPVLEDTDLTTASSVPDQPAFLIVTDCQQADLGSSSSVETSLRL